MRVAMPLRALLTAVLAALVLTGAAPAGAGLRIGDLDVVLGGRELTVNVGLLDAIAPGAHEGLRSGIPTHVRYTVEVWQYHRYWPDSLLLTRIVERALAYNVVTKEYRVTAVRGEARAPHVTRDLHDAQRMLSEVRGLKLAPAGNGVPAEIYVRVHAETGPNGENSFVTRLAGTAEQARRRSDPRTLPRVP
jgi:Domain of unknown function (DUF4390)